MELVASAIAQALQIREVAQQSTVETLKWRLREKRLLLVLDNFEHLVEASSPLCRRFYSLACPGLTVLATSRRDPTHLQGEHVYPVSPLLLPIELNSFFHRLRWSALEAIQLFVERARAVSA